MQSCRRAVETDAQAIAVVGVNAWRAAYRGIMPDALLDNLNIAERRLPQDGRMRMRVGGRDIDLRVSFLPTVHGEKCVLRVLDKNASIVPMAMPAPTAATPFHAS